MKDLSELKSYDTLRQAAEILGVRLPLIWSPTEENYIVGKHGGVGIGVQSECRARLYLYEIDRDKEWTVEDTINRMIGAMPEKAQRLAQELYAEWRHDSHHGGN